MTTFALATAGYAEAGPTADQGARVPYLVQFADAPIAAYAGGVPNLAATKPIAGAKLDRGSQSYQDYRKYIRMQRADALRKAKLDGRKPVAEYEAVLNGVVLALTPAEVSKLVRISGVHKLWKNSYVPLETVTTPKFLGLDGQGGVWQRQFGGAARAGEGVIVGILDSGITPESASFAALPEPRPDAAIIADRWRGVCDPGEEAPVTCNNKLLGARYYNFGKEPIDQEFRSPRDFDGHGTHTASTAAGNNGVTATINGENFGKISGVAPAARVAAYKICWELPDLSTANCGGFETAAALEDAVKDGVDVVNYSIGGQRATVDDPVNLAFLNTAFAGVFIAASAGNTAGPSTVAHNVPWLTTVAASTHNRTFSKTVTLGNGVTYTGAGILGALPPTPLVDAVGSGVAGEAGAKAEFCALGSLDRSKVENRIVLCARGGEISRTDKSRAVQQAGGVGMIMYNPTPNSVNADFHPIPSIHVGHVEGAAIKAYVAGAGDKTASMTAAVPQKARAPQLASFSSSGPALAAGGDVLKPDITAPGVDVIAAVAPPNNFGNSFDAYSGTSMSSPHIAGIAALLRGKFPHWSPMAIKSAIMTTAGQLDETGAPMQREGGAPASPLDFGAGHVRPAPAFDPGLVYDAGPAQWLQFTCGQGVHILVNNPPQDSCDLVGAADASDYNAASIAVGDLAGKQTITRTVTNTTGRSSVYFAKVQAPAGYRVRVTPSVLTVLPHRSATYQVEITRTDAAFGAFSFGSLSWADLRGHTVRSPIALRSVHVAVPSELVGTGASGSIPVPAVGGYDGQLTARPVGLVESTVGTRHLTGVNTDFDPAKPAEGPSVGKFVVDVPAGVQLARVATFAVQYPAGTDLDMVVYKDGTLVDVSADATAEEAVTLAGPGRYEVYVVQFRTVGPPDQDVHLHTFALPPTAAGNLTATPSSQPVTIGQQVTVTAGWSGLSAGKHYLGMLEFGDGTATRGQTILTVHA